MGERKGERERERERERTRNILRKREEVKLWDGGKGDGVMEAGGRARKDSRKRPEGEKWNNPESRWRTQLGLSACWEEFVSGDKRLENHRRSLRSGPTRASYMDRVTSQMLITLGFSMNL